MVPLEERYRWSTLEDGPKRGKVFATKVIGMTPFLRKSKNEKFVEVSRMIRGGGKRKTTGAMIKNVEETIIEILWAINKPLE